MVVNCAFQADVQHEFHSSEEVKDSSFAVVDYVIR